MGRLFVVKLKGHVVYRCNCCHTDIALFTDIVTRGGYGLFGIDGRLYAFRRLYNTFLDASTVSPRFGQVFCVVCSALIGSYINGRFGTRYVLCFEGEVPGPEGSNDEA